MLKDLGMASVISASLFILLTIFSFFLHLEYWVNFKLGLPWTFYHQFMIDGLLHHGTNPADFLKDILSTWILTTTLWLFWARIKKNNNKNKPKTH